MTELDKTLIIKASDCNDWSDIKELESQAESDQAKRRLHIRKMELYHREEEFAGLL